MKAATSDDEPERPTAPPQPQPAPPRQPLRSPPPPTPPALSPKPPQGAQNAPQPPRDGLRGPVHFSQSEIDEFARRGFLATERPDWFAMQNAIFDLIETARVADLKPQAKPATADAIPG